MFSATKLQIPLRCDNLFLFFCYILVLLELTLLHKYFEEILEIANESFNPCCIGTYSITYKKQYSMEEIKKF